ncbi:MAG: methyltransferase, TIGR04325 family [Chromatiaceae bacterium]|nr:methyltransferase, TIGR04325 family [Chromatiaceae bacterium]
MTELIPIALFAYARPDHLRRTLACLRDNRVPLIIAICDGPKTPDKAPQVAEVRALLRGIDWCEVELHEREDNRGLGRSIMAGVTEVLDRYNSCLVFEDDLICVPGAYDYLCAALRHYQDDPQVMSVTGWTHPRLTPKDVADRPYFDGRAECWVWGTWARAWAGMNDQTAEQMMLACEARGIDRNHYGNDLPIMAAAELRQNIWAVRWLYHHLLRGGLCLRPPWSLVEHIGFDALATNAGSASGWANPPLRACPPVPSTWPDAVEHAACGALQRRAFPPPPVLPPSPPPGLARRITRRLRRLTVALTGSTRLESLSVRPAVEGLTPPLLLRAYRAGRRRMAGGTAIAVAPSAALQLTGQYATWSAAQADSAGYDAGVILERTRAALLKVKRGEAVYERDSVLFEVIEYSWPVLAGLMWVAAQHDCRLNVLDLGGSLGSTYFQNRAFLDRLGMVRWNIVEQPRHVEVGRQAFQDERLRFYQSIDACLAETQPNVILLSGVLQYLEVPYDLLNSLQATSCRFLILDLTFFWAGPNDRLCVQHVPPDIYPASYPAWIFSWSRFRSILSLHWSIIADFDDHARMAAPVPLNFRGLIAVRIP